MRTPKRLREEEDYDDDESMQYQPAGDMTRVSVMPRKVTVKIGDAENRCRGCRDKNQ